MSISVRDVTHFVAGAAIALTSVFGPQLYAQVMSPSLTVKLEGPSAIVAGQPVVYVVTAHNGGTTPLTDLIFVDNYHPSLRFVSATGNGCQVYPTNVQCPRVSLAPGQRFSVAFTYAVDVQKTCEVRIAHISGVAGGAAGSPVTSMASARVCPSATKISKITNAANNGASPTAVPAGVTDIASFRFFTNNGLKTATVTDLILNVDALNLAISTSSFRLIRKSAPGNPVACKVLSPANAAMIGSSPLIGSIIQATWRP